MNDLFILTNKSDRYLIFRSAGTFCIFLMNNNYWSFVWKTLLGPRPKLHHDLHVFCLCVIRRITRVNWRITHVNWQITLVKYLIPGLQLFFS